MKNIAYAITGNGTVTLSLNNRSYLINSDHINYEEIVNCLKNHKYDEIYDYVNISDTVAGKSKGQIVFKDGSVYWNNTILHNSITDRILKFYKEGLPYEPLLNFIKNLMLNPSENSINQIYRFLETNNLPITPDGCVLFYKRVRDDYRDIHTGTFDNGVGNRVSMPRNQVVEDPEQTCSSGLHVCSLGYLKSFGCGYKIVVCKVDPANIVSVPVDYQNTKVRVCEYLVVGEWSSDEVDMFDGDLVRNDDCSEYDYEEEEDYYYQDEEDSYEEDENYRIQNVDDCCGGQPECREECDFNMNEHLKQHFEVHNNQVSKHHSIDVSYKPNGQKFYNVRDKSGKFVKKS
jgi:hypothetical protein